MKTATIISTALLVGLHIVCFAPEASAQATAEQQRAASAAFHEERMTQAAQAGAAQQASGSAASAPRRYKAPKGTLWDYPDGEASDRYKREWKEAHAARKADKAREKAYKAERKADQNASGVAASPKSKAEPKAKSKAYKAKDYSQYPDGRQPSQQPRRTQKAATRRTNDYEIKDLDKMTPEQRKLLLDAQKAINNPEGN